MWTAAGRTNPLVNEECPCGRTAKNASGLRGSLFCNLAGKPDPIPAPSGPCPFPYRADNDFGSEAAPACTALQGRFTLLPNCRFRIHRRAESFPHLPNDRIFPAPAHTSGNKLHSAAGSRHPRLRLPTSRHPKCPAGPKTCRDLGQTAPNRPFPEGRDT